MMRLKKVVLLGLFVVGFALALNGLCHLPMAPVFAQMAGEDPALIEEQGLPKVPILVNLTSGPNKPQAAAMALEFAAEAVEDGREVTLYFSIHGVLFLKKGAARELGFSENRLGEILSILRQANVKALASPSCLKTMGITAADLPPNVVISTPELLFAPLDKHGAVFTF